MSCPKCKKATEPEWSICPFCQTPLQILEAEPVLLPEGSDSVESHQLPLNSPGGNPYATPVDQQTAYADHPQASEGDATGGVIPYKNPKALIAYYLGIVSGLPLIGFPFGIAAFVLGILGLKARKRNPAIKGAAHAWIGIGCGGIFMILWGLLIVGLIVTVIAEL
jgi:hypothetical protein